MNPCPSLAGRLSSLNGSAATYVYNGLGQRVSKTVSGTGTVYAYDEAGHLVGEYVASTGAPIQETIWLGDTPIAVVKGSGTYYMHAGHLNTPRQIEDAAGDPVWVWDTITFGSSTPDEDPLATGTPFVYNLRHPGQVFDAESGLFQNWHRDYSPGLGRYVESDPIGLAGGLNTYGYVHGNPISFIDPQGLAEEHTKNARPSTEEKHQKGQARRQKDYDGEKGDQNRGYPRQRPQGWKGPWPPKQAGFVNPTWLAKATFALSLLTYSDGLACPPGEYGCEEEASTPLQCSTE